MYWGGVSDRVGRKPVIILGCLGTMSSLILVGLAPNFYVALTGRILGGALNGNIGVIQTVVGELVKNPDHEPRAYAVMPFVWSIGAIIGRKNSSHPCIIHLVLIVQLLLAAILLSPLKTFLGCSALLGSSQHSPIFSQI